MFATPLTRPSCFAFFAVALTALIFAGAAQAQPSYRVEVLAFEQPDGSGTDPALWAFDATPATPSDAQFADASAPRSLNGIRSRLEAAGYPTVAHVAWQQPVLSQAGAVPTVVPVNDSARGSLGGLMTVYRGRYLHIDTDLHYRATGGAQREARLRVGRKVPAGQAVYLDHEIFGVIVFLSR